MAEIPFDKPQKANVPLGQAPAAASLSRPTQRRWWIGFAAIVAIFLAGFLPMWLKAGRTAGERDTAQREVRLLRLESLAAAAVIDARRGEYESARQSTSRFFTALRAEMDLGPQSSLTLAQQEPLMALLARRDDIITLLARSDAACAERLTEVYLGCRKSLRGEAPSDPNAAQSAKP